MKDYKKEYEEALSRGVKFKEEFLNYKELKVNKDVIKKFNNIFPELIESEDEEIRKALSDCVEDYRCKGVKNFFGVPIENVLSWLEKQEEQKLVEESWPNLSNCLHDCKNCTGRCIYRKEEYQNQKSDKVEPKFKVGDWIVYETEEWREVLQIETIEFERYTFTNGSSSSYAEEQNMRLWTIQDAKDGDVLYMDNGLSTCTFIYKSINNTIIQKYASYNKFGFEGRHYLVLNDGYVCPATKEQRDLLFQKMKEAGYEWDAEKKELKKIEQKNIIEIPFGAKDSELQEVTYYIPEGFHAEIKDNKIFIRKGEQKSTWSEGDDFQCREAIEAVTETNYSDERKVDVITWLKTIKGRVQPQQKPEWSEEDKERLNRIASFIWKNRKGDTDEIYQQEQDANWLKSLKDKVRLSSDEKSIPSKEFVLNVWMLGNEWKNITKGVCSTEHGTQLEYVLKHWKEGEYYEKIKSQSHWKPSEKQMETLGKYVRCTVKDDHEHLEAIYNHLKKL